MKAIEAIHRCPGAPILFTGSPKAAAVVRKGIWPYGVIALYMTDDFTVNDIKAINQRMTVWYWPEPTAASYGQALDVIQIVPHIKVIRPSRGIMSLETGEIAGGDLWYFLENKAMSFNREQCQRLKRDYEQRERVAI